MDPGGVTRPTVKGDETSVCKPAQGFVDPASASRGRTGKADQSSELLGGVSEDRAFEPQGYVLDGIPYLPDFKLVLPGDRLVFAEVKPAEADWHEGRHVQLCRALARETGWPVILLIGVPAYRAYHQFTRDLAVNAFQAVFFRDYEPKIAVVDGYWWPQIEIDSRTGALDFPHDDHQARKSFGQGFVDAVQAARSARFEHGSGGVRPSPREGHDEP